jgi:hypothetical protein
VGLQEYHPSALVSIYNTFLEIIMGVAVSKFIEEVEGQDEKKKTANDALNALKVLCDVKAKAFFDEIVSDTASAGAKLLPVNKVTAKDHSTYCNFKKDAESTSNEINSAIGSFIKGEVVSIVCFHIALIIDGRIAARPYDDHQRSHEQAYRLRQRKHE